MSGSKEFEGIPDRPQSDEGTLALAVTEAQRKWETACRAWSRDNLDQIEETMRLGEVMMFAATDYICAIEDALAKGRTLSDTLNAYGYPVSKAHWANASGQMSVQSRALHLAADGFRAALAREAGQ